MDDLAKGSIVDRLQLRNVSVYGGYGGLKPFLSNVNIGIQRRQILGLLGPNGSGKTSLIRAIAGFIPHKSESGVKRLDISWGQERRRVTGEILVDGEDVTYVRPGERGMSLVPQDLALYPDKSVLQNILFPLSVKRLDKREAQVRALDMARRLGLDQVLSRLPTEISGGQQQRVAIGRALISRPKLVLLDEPLASLDVLIKREVLALFGAVIREWDASAVFVSHDPEEVSHLCDVVAFLEDGVLHQLATPRQAFENPATLFVAQVFSGFSNVLCGEFLNEDIFLVHGTEGSLHLATLSGMNSKLQIGRVYWLAARPSAFIFDDNASREGGIPGVVTGAYHSEGMNYARVKISNRFTVSCLMAFERQSFMGDSGKVLLSPLAMNNIRFFPEDNKC